MAATLAGHWQDKLGDPINYGNSDAAYLIIDTRRFSQFSIDNLKYEVLINGLQANQSHGNFATSLSFDVLDSVGISFINFIRWIMIDKMQTNYDGMLYMLRTIFCRSQPWWIYWDCTVCHYTNAFDQDESRLRSRSRRICDGIHAECEFWHC